MSSEMSYLDKKVILFKLSGFTLSPSEEEVFKELLNKCYEDGYEDGGNSCICKTGRQICTNGLLVEVDIE